MNPFKYLSGGIGGNATSPSLVPMVLHPITLPNFIQYLIDNHISPTTLIICSTRESFLQDLLDAILKTDGTAAPPSPQFPEAGAEATTSTANSSDPLAQPLHPLLVPTLRQLFNAGTTKLVFCATLPSLQAYLSAYKAPLPSKVGFGRVAVPPPIERGRSGIPKSPILGLLNPLALHKETTAFSAQGLSRTFASAIDAAARNRQRLIIAECMPDLGGLVPDHLASVGGTQTQDSSHGILRRTSTAMDLDPSDSISAELNAKLAGRRAVQRDPWSESVPMLNTTTRSYGASERGWVGRTVEIKRIVERWCRFERGDRETLGG